MLTTSRSAMASFTVQLGSLSVAVSNTVVLCWRALAYHFKVCNGFVDSQLGSLRVAASIIYSHCVQESACLPFQGLQ